MLKYMPATSSTRLELTASTLAWRHMAPTAPDTLGCHPFSDRDPFILECTPDLYVVGNQPHFQTKMVGGGQEVIDGDQRGCRIVLVPGFAKTGVLVLVELRTLSVKTVDFSTR